MKKIIRLTESDLTRIVRRIINEQEGAGAGAAVAGAAQTKDKNPKDKWGRPMYDTKGNGGLSFWWGYNTATGKWEQGRCNGLSGKTQQNECKRRLPSFSGGAGGDW